MNAITGIRMKNPAHPGGFVKSEIAKWAKVVKDSGAKIDG